LDERLLESEISEEALEMPARARPARRGDAENFILKG
jgi:hypothetical protein